MIVVVSEMSGKRRFFHIMTKMQRVPRVTVVIRSFKQNGSHAVVVIDAEAQAAQPEKTLDVSARKLTLRGIQKCLSWKNGRVLQIAWIS